MWDYSATVQTPATALPTPLGQRRDENVLHGTVEGLDASVGVELTVDSADVVVYGTLADPELGGDPFAELALPGAAED